MTISKKQSAKTPSRKKSSKKDLLEKYRTHKEDTGSSEVQVALFSKKIDELIKHLKEHANDFDSKRGLLIMLGKRRKMLNYLSKADEDGKRYQNLINDLGLRR